METCDIDPKLKPILAYVGKLTQTPSRMMQADADAVYAAGWTEQALFDAISVCALFNMMNQIVEGAGISIDPLALPEDDKAARRARMATAGADPYSAERRYSKLAALWNLPD